MGVRTSAAKLIAGIIAILALMLLIVVAITGYNVSRTLRDVLLENKILRESLARLTQEDQIGYAKVVRQEQRDGKTLTTLKFVETSREDKTRRILEKEYTVEGDIVHFDALVVTFDTRLVADGRERSLYLWRRIYGETMAPRQGLSIEEAGREPARYATLLERLDLKDRELFWNAIWDLSNAPDRLHEYGIRAIHGSVVYTQLKPGMIYVFTISATGQLMAQTVPEM